jgi:hypothetical protein
MVTPNFKLTIPEADQNALKGHLQNLQKSPIAGLTSVSQYLWTLRDINNQMHESCKLDNQLVCMR